MNAIIILFVFILMLGITLVIMYKKKSLYIFNYLDVVLVLSYYFL